MENFTNTNEIFTVDLTSAKSPADAVFDLTKVLDNENAFGKRIFLKLANMDLSESQLLSLKSLISSINSSLDFLQCDSAITQQSAQNIGIELPASEEIENTFYQQPQQIVEEPMEEPMEQPFEQQFEENTKEQSEEPENNNFTQTQINNDYQEQELVDFAPHTQEEIYSNNEPSYQETFDFEKQPEIENNIEEEPEQQEETPNESENFLQELQPSIEFDELNKNTNVQTKGVQRALEHIFDSGSNTLDSIKEEVKDDVKYEPDEKLTEEDLEIEQMSVKYVKQTVRSGNVISSEGNLVIIGDCHPGSEIHAAGDITVWGLLGGIAHAGNKGNKKAKVRALQFNPIQLRIANLYSRRPDALHTIYVDRTDTFKPEEAKILNDEIIIYTMNEK